MDLHLVHNKRVMRKSCAAYKGPDKWFRKGISMIEMVQMFAEVRWPQSSDHGQSWLAHGQNSEHSSVSPVSSLSVV